MSRRIVVIGAGLAGLAAAWRARRNGHDVTIVSAGAGASALGSGAVDDVPWEQLVRSARALGLTPRARPLSDDLHAFASDLGVWSLDDDHLAWVATLAGRLRPARGRDHALLDFAKLDGARVLLPRADRAAWDADSLAAGLSDDPFARAHRITFVAADVPVLRFAEERRIADGDLALRHDAEPRLAWLTARLLDGLAQTKATAVLVGPWLGANTSQSEALSKRVGVPVGEALCGVGSPAGLRFEAARDRLLAAIGARVIADRVTTIDRDADALAITLERGASLLVDGVVLALGGLTSGGLVYDPPDHSAAADLPARVRPPFTLSLHAPVTLVAHLGADPLTSDATSSMHGPAIEATAWPRGDRAGMLESVGIRCNGARAAEGITAAGDVVARRPRTALEAVAAGIRAGSEA
ncbi:MAG: FAD-dependent oxidoreductase [Byssovorax sp.]